MLDSLRHVSSAMAASQMQAIYYLENLYDEGEDSVMNFFEEKDAKECVVYSETRSQHVLKSAAHFYAGFLWITFLVLFGFIL